MDIWDILLIFHLLAMAFFVGGQLVLAVAVAPVLAGTEEIKPIARKFGMYSGISLLVSLLTGLYLASHFELWDAPARHAKLGILVVLIGVIGFGHMKRGNDKAIQALMLALTLALVVLGVMVGN